MARKYEQPLMIRLTTEMHEALKERAAAEERTTAQIIRLAVREYLDQEG